MEFHDPHVKTLKQSFKPVLNDLRSSLVSSNHIKIQAYEKYKIQNMNKDDEYGMFILSDLKHAL